MSILKKNINLRLTNCRKNAKIYCTKIKCRRIFNYERILMGMKKRLLAVLAAVLLFSLMLTSCVDNFVKVEISADGYFVINGEKTDTKVPFADKLIDENRQGLAFYLKEDSTYVVEIGNGEARYLTRIDIPAVYNFITVTEVGRFSSEDLREISIPNTVTKIRACAFEECVNLVSVEIPDSVTSIGKSAFIGCTALEDVILPASITTIENFTFEYCESLKNIYFRGTEEQWSKITIGKNNSYLDQAEIHFNYEPEHARLFGRRR